MGEKPLNHQEQEASPQLNPADKVQGQGPVSEETSPTAAAQRALNTPPVARKPSDYLALQKTVGNRAVQRIVQAPPGAVQREFRDDPDFQTWRMSMRGALRSLQSSLIDVDTRHSSEGEAVSTGGDRWSAMADVWNQAAHGGGGGGGGGGSGGGGGGGAAVSGQTEEAQG